MRFALVLIACLSAGAAQAQAIASASYAEPTTRYAHGVLGDDVEWGAMELRLTDGTTRTLRLPETRVFEDLAPRLITGAAGETLAMVVESEQSTGARLALYGPDGLVAATPHIGRSNRWLAPVGAGDLDGDGLPEVAYVDRPHLAKTLRIWRLTGAGLVEIAALEGVTNHKIGWDYIAGGLRDCDVGPEMILASGDWRRLLAVRFDGASLEARDLGAWSAAAAEAALACR